MQPETPIPAPIAIVVRDLIFSSRIIAEARAANIPYIMVRNPDVLATLDPSVRFLIVDLNLAGAIAAARQWREKSHNPIIGFVSHVDADTIALAREAGFDQILPRSRFVQILPQLILS